MANWKEKGEVPDSDDDDALDTQSIPSDDEPPNEEQNNDIRNTESIIEIRNDETEEGILKQGRLAISDATVPAVLDDLNVTPPTFVPVHTSEPKLCAKHVDGNDRVPASSPGSPKVFKIPKVFWENEEEGVAEEDEQRSMSTSDNEEPADDEVSKTYVQITSPTSSIISLPPASQASLPPNSPINDRESTVRQYGGHENFLHDHPVTEDIQVLQTTTYAGRSLRQRNPIQLHPYIVEQEKYRQTLKARGIAPMRIEPSQDESYYRSRHTASPEPDSQEKYSQDATETGDSQPMDFDWDLPSSPPQKVHENNAAATSEAHKSATRDDDEEADEDEEFPNIDQLLTTWQPLPHTIKPRNRMKSYSTKPNQWSKVRNDRKGDLFGEAALISAANVPASPPVTSSPLPTASRESVCSRSQTKSRLPRRLDESSRTLSGQNKPNIQTFADLPTPATSATKPIPFLVDSDSEDELAREREISSSNESIQIRKVSKKIRGVLPASHLRLDYMQRKPQPSSRTRRESLSISPVRSEARRGVALPRTSRSAQSPSVSVAPGFDFLSSDSEEDEEENRASGFVFEDSPSSPLGSLLSQSRLGFAEEDDRVDAMLPSHKRHSTSSKTRPRKKSRIGSSILFRAIDKAYAHQPKITEHLSHPRQSESRIPSSKQPTTSGSTPRRQNDSYLSLPSKPAPPQLSILDVVDTPRYLRSLPQFIKIAIRTARSKVGLGKQSPSRKFIRLANREDTHDAQSVLEDWRGGRLLPKPPQSIYSASPRFSRFPLKEIENNRQTKLQAPVPKLKSCPQTSNTGSASSRRKLIISRVKQQSMNAFITREQPNNQNRKFVAKAHAPRLAIWREERPQHVSIAARFAQLESSENQHSPQQLASAFRSTKKSLDALYRITRKRPVSQANLQLSRFLADEDMVRHSVKKNDIGQSAKPEVFVTTEGAVGSTHKRSWRKNRLPQRLDAGAAIYRQPSDPLILDFLVPRSGPDTETTEGHKLLGLAKFGTYYPLNFDIFPLRPGVFFHESTFIGSGRLSEAIRRSGDPHLGCILPQTSLMLAGKTFCWGKWNEDVSSEMGLTFDWLVEQLISERSPLSSPPPIDTVGAISFVLKYVHNHLSFGGSDDIKNFLYRMAEILQDFSSRLAIAGDNSEYMEIRARIDVMSISMLLLLELIRIARARAEEPVAYQLEDLMKKFAAHCVKALVSQGLDRVRKLYDDLQYLSFREYGITNDEYVVQGWVITMKVLDAARIPRGSFWDVTNLQLDATHPTDISDARIMEKLWYSIFSLLPLCEFDEFGVVIEDLRQDAAFDNWPLVQRMLKRVFALYHANQRQSPGFNDYCRAIVSRCHLLMVEWGWWNCSGLVGTLFDFFAAHKLAHLRNEEAYASPRFLQDLNAEPHLLLEIEDRCFHLFLKIVALAIKHFQQVGEDKHIRNLVARLMPNHNRQYPKEESIHQRDLASLRNHHDLLCTLYWAAPSQHRPSPNVIQELVLVDHSHKEACLINLRAWEQLASFILTQNTEKDAYQPLKQWYQDLFSKLIQQYLRIEGEIRDQAHALQGVNEQTLHEKQLQDIIMANQGTMITSIYTSVKAIAHLIEVAHHTWQWVGAYETLDPEQIEILLKYSLSTPNTHSRLLCALLDAYLDVLKAYMDRVEGLALLTQDESDSSDASDHAEKRLEQRLSAPFLFLLRHYLGGLSPVYNISGVDEIYQRLITGWARYAALCSDKWEGKCDGHAIVEFECLTDAMCEIFSRRHKNRVQAHYWPHFLAKLLEYKKSPDLESLHLPFFDFGKEWLISLASSEPNPFLNEFTTQLQKKGFRLSDGISCDWNPTQKLRGAIRNMGDHMQVLTEAFSNKNAISKHLYTALLVDVMKEMQTQLETIDPPAGAKYETYLKMVHQVAADIKCHCADICQLPRFFLVPSRNYRPPEADPEFYTQGILNYCRNLVHHRERTSFELFYYLIGGWKKAYVHGEGAMSKHIKHLDKAMKNSDFMSFLLADFIPAIVQTGFKNLLTQASLTYLAYFPSLAYRIGALLNREEAEASRFFRQVINLLRIIMNCLLGPNQDNAMPMYWNPRNEERSVRTMVCYFWLEVLPYLENHIQRIRDDTPEDEQRFSELNQAFLHYLKRMEKHLDYPEECPDDCPYDWMIEVYPVEDTHFCADFERALEDDIGDRVIRSGEMSVKLGQSTYRVLLRRYDNMIPTFEDVLSLGRIGRHATIPGISNFEIMSLEL